MRCRGPRRSSRTRQAGLTLVELLVSMLIMGFVLTLVSQAVFQVAQVSRSAQAITTKLVSRWSGGWAAVPMIANLVAPMEATEGRAFVGDASRLEGFTTHPPSGEASGIRPFALRLRNATGAATGTELVVSEETQPGRQTDEQVISSFDRRVEFAYVDSAGTVQPVWPPNSVSGTREPEDLPRTVMLRDAGSQEILMWYGFQGEVYRPRPAYSPFGTTP